jgi:hypothetical protein
MRTALLGILLASTSALAQSASAPPPAAPTPATAPAPALRGNGLSLVAVNDLPEACHDLGKLADSPAANRALSARISLASCLVEQRTKPLVLCDCEQSVRDLESASAQSISLLDEVAAVGDPATKILALQTKADLLAGLALRILATVPAAVDGSEAAVNLRHTRLDLIHPHITPWQQQAKNAYQELDRIARANPQLAKNPAVLAAVRASRNKLSQLEAGIAKR